VSTLGWYFGDWLERLYGADLSDEDRRMAHLIHSCWVGFAKKGIPDCDGQTWPAMTADRDELLEFGPDIGIVKDFRKAQYKALESVFTPG
jgi:para-nitrobenzyl esterase